MYGESPYHYLKKLRMNFAAHKLHETELSILEIAISVGYNNPSKFSNAFKSILGVLPSTFRKQKNGMEH
ncbi:helix-turn-helix domain-containing protein [Vallitalea sediminicola]